MDTRELIDQDEEATRPTVASRLAVLSFASGLVVCCPGTGALALVTGALALIIGLGETNVRWRKFAVGGVALGAMSLAIIGVLYFVVHGWWEREGRILYSGPNNALVALERGSSATFKAEFTGAGAAATQDAVESFGTQLREQFGTFRVCRSTRQSEPLLEGPGPWSLGEFEAFFDKGTPPAVVRVAAEIGITRLPSGTLRLTWVEIDPDGVRLRFPPSTQERSLTDD